MDILKKKNFSEKLFLQNTTLFFEYKIIYKRNQQQQDYNEFVVKVLNNTSKCQFLITFLAQEQCPQKKDLLNTFRYLREKLLSIADFCTLCKSRSRSLKKNSSCLVSIGLTH